MDRLETEITKNGNLTPLDPNKVYSTPEGTFYHTDSKGRVEKISFVLNGPGDLKPANVKRIANSDDTVPFGSRLSGVSTDIGFHGRADAAKGVPDYPNLQPGDNNLNNSAFKSVERKYIDAAKAGQQAAVDVTYIYGPASDIRPTHIDIEVTSNGQAWSKTFVNDGTNGPLPDADKDQLKSILGL